jgi:16S rRNA (cytidine1402-2'-O)-methyltransferase
MAGPDRTEAPPEPSPGVLYLVPTPIGNLGDLSPRARAVLAAVDLVAAEDTRVTRKLLSWMGASPELWSCHDHNEGDRAAQLVGALKAGRRVALVSDAGTPLISDPGHRVVQEVVAAGFLVVPLPGPVAAVAALSGSGLPVDRFAFLGFLPRQDKARAELLAWVGAWPLTLAFYASPHRLGDELSALAAAFGDRPAALARDLSKRGERFWRGPLPALAAEVGEWDEIGGEWVVMVGPAPDEAPAGLPAAALRLVTALRAEGVGPRRVRDLVAEAFDLPRREVYAAALEAPGPVSASPGAGG